VDVDSGSKSTAWLNVGRPRAIWRSPEITCAVWRITKVANYTVRQGLNLDSSGYLPQLSVHVNRRIRSTVRS